METPGTFMGSFMDVGVFFMGISYRPLTVCSDHSAEETSNGWTSDPHQGALGKPAHPSRPLPVGGEGGSLEQPIHPAAQGQERTA